VVYYGTVRYYITPIGLFRVIEPVEVLYFKVRYAGTSNIAYGTSSYIQLLPNIHRNKVYPNIYRITGVIF